MSYTIRSIIKHGIATKINGWILKPHGSTSENVSFRVYIAWSTSLRLVVLVHVVHVSSLPGKKSWIKIKSHRHDVSAGVAA